MKTSIIGYPRIGSLRELKFASEKYFRSEIPSEELLETAKEIRLNNRNIQKANGIDLIPSNDFSLYFLPTVKYYIRISLATHFYVVFKRYLCVIYFLSNYRLPLVPFGVFNILRTQRTSLTVFLPTTVSVFGLSVQRLSILNSAWQSSTTSAHLTAL